ncbi:MAG: glycoside hydrolase family 9 protein [Flavobacteriales bacterium]|nr:glycoside hydrolase family 9 protein [Flavobacteriales bacterium]
MNDRLRILLAGIACTGLFFSGQAQVNYTVEKNIRVDQFGYRPQDDKVAVLTDPQSGFNASESYQPGITMEVRRLYDGTTAFTGSSALWNNGATQSQSGDKGWHFDFSALTDTGTYYVFDPANQVGSYPFIIQPHVYFEVLKAAARVYFYQRCGFSKQLPFAENGWTDGASYLASGQDSEAHSVDDKNNAGLVKDMRGGWYDAGDNNKYVTFTESVMHQLLDAYRFQPAIWTDDFGIPESGNNLPDILDEVMWELDWIKRMQDTVDGGVHIKIGDIDYTSPSPPSSDTGPRYYGPKCSSSTIVTAGIFAHAAVVLSAFPSLATYVDDLMVRAEKAWDWYGQNARSTNCDTQEIVSGDADKSLTDQDQSAVTAAAYLFGITGKQVYANYVNANYTAVTLLNWWGPYGVAYGDGLLYYAALSGADQTVANAIRAAKQSNANSVGDFYGFSVQKDLYRSWMPDAQYHWGSNQIKACTGIINLDMNLYALDATDSLQYAKRALASVHYMHGVNPMGLVYLSNMADRGAENSVNTIYHSWFADGSAVWDDVRTSTYGPAPGYVPGGPNKDYAGSLAWIGNEPVQKSYHEWNTGYPENSWEITEPGIYYQSAYIRLLASFTELPAVDCFGETGGGAFVDSCGICAGGNTGITPVTDPDNCTTGMEAMGDRKWIVFPNPVKGLLNIKPVDGSSFDYMVYDALGRVIISGVGSGNLAISMEGRPAGMYFLRVTSSGENLTLPLVVQDSEN